MKLYEKILRITEILDTSSCTRQKLADNMSISLSSVNSVINEMKSARVVGEYDSSNKSAGRNTGVIHLRNDPVFAIADISEAFISTCIFGYGLDIKTSFRFEISDKLFLDDSLISYFKVISDIRPKIKYICVSSRGVPSGSGFANSGIHNLDGIPISQIAQEFLPDTKITLLNKTNYLCNDTRGVYAVMTDSSGKLRIEIFKDGVCLSNKSVSFSECNKYSAIPQTGRLKYATDFEEYTEIITTIIGSITSLIEIDRVYFHTARYSDANVTVNKIKEIFESRSYTTNTNITPLTEENFLFPTPLLKAVKEFALEEIFSK